MCEESRDDDDDKRFPSPQQQEQIYHHRLIFPQLSSKAVISRQGARLENASASERWREPRTLKVTLPLRFVILPLGQYPNRLFLRTFAFEIRFIMVSVVVSGSSNDNEGQVFLFILGRMCQRSSRDSSSTATHMMWLRSRWCRSDDAFSCDETKRSVSFVLGTEN